MSYHALPITGMPASRTTVQRVTELEKQTEANQQRIAACDKAIAGQFKEGRLVTSGGKPDLATWSEPLETDPDFAEEFAQTFDDTPVPEADDEFGPASCDSYLNMELALKRDDTTPEFAKVTKRMKDAAGNPISAAHDNPTLDARSYKVEHLDGHKAAMSVNIVAENMLAQVDHDGHPQEERIESSRKSSQVTGPKPTSVDLRCQRLTLTASASTRKQRHPVAGRC
jgi:hypothetical protein